MWCRPGEIRGATQMRCGKYRLSGAEFRSPSSPIAAHLRSTHRCHLAPVAPVLGRAERLGLNRFDFEIGLELQDCGVKVLQVENHLAKGFMRSLDIAGQLGTAFDQAAHNECVHGENRFQSPGFVVLTPRTIMTTMAMAAIKRA